MKIFRRFLFAMLVVAIAAYFMPWKTWLENWMKNELSARGMAQLEFSIDTIGLNKISFKNIALGELELPDIAIGYTPQELLNGNLRDLHASSLTFHKDKLAIELHDVSAHLAPDAKGEKFTGNWQIEAINVSGLPLAIPALAGKGTVELAEGNLKLIGNIASNDAKTKSNFTLNYLLYNNKEAILTIHNLATPWNEGVISSKNISVPIYAKTPIKANLNVKSVSLNSLLAAATSNRANATGLVSGTIPLIIERNGNFILKNGNLRTEKAGKIMLSPDVIPANNPQITILREVLTNFNYETFNMGIEGASNDQLSMTLSLLGNNPEAYNGRAIKLNVKLTGNLADLVGLGF